MSMVGNEHPYLGLKRREIEALKRERDLLAKQLEDCNRVFTWVGDKFVQSQKANRAMQAVVEAARKRVKALKLLLAAPNQTALADLQIAYEEAITEENEALAAYDKEPTDGD